MTSELSGERTMLACALPPAAKHSASHTDSIGLAQGSLS